MATQQRQEVKSPRTSKLSEAFKKVRGTPQERSKSATERQGKERAAKQKDSDARAAGGKLRTKDTTGKQAKSPTTPTGEAKAGPFDKLVEQHKARQEGSKADLVEAKSQEQQIKTAALQRQADEAGLQIGPPAPLATTMARLQGPTARGQLSVGERIDPIIAQLQLMQSGLDTSIDANKIRELSAQYQPQNAMANALAPWVEKRLARFDEIEERQAELRADAPGVGDYILSALTLGIYDPSHDDELKRLEREKQLLTRSLFGIAESTATTAQRGRQAFQAQAFQSVLQDVQNKKQFAQQLGLFGIQRATQLESDTAQRKMQFEIAAQQREFRMEAQRVEEEAKKAAQLREFAHREGLQEKELIAKGLAPDPEAEEKQAEMAQGKTDFLQSFASKMPQYSGPQDVVYKASLHLLKSELAKREVDANLLADEVAAQIGTGVLTRRAMKLVQNDLLPVHSQSKARGQSERAGTAQTHYTSGSDAAHGVVNTFFDAIEQAAVRLDTEKRLTASGRELVITESGAIESFLRDNEMMAVPGDLERSIEAVVYGTIDGIPHDSATLIRKSEDWKIKGDPQALRRIALAVKGRQIEKTRMGSNKRFEDDQMTAWIESQINGLLMKNIEKKHREGLHQATIREQIRKAQRAAEPRGPQGFSFATEREQAIIRALKGDARVLSEWDADDILNEIKAGTANKTVFGLGDRIFRNTPALAPVLKKLGWTSIDAIKEKMGKSFQTLSFKEPKIVTLEQEKAKRKKKGTKK